MIGLIFHWSSSTTNYFAQFKRVRFTDFVHKFRMNDKPIELCERNSYTKTIKLLEKATENRRRLGDFTNFLKEEKDKKKENKKCKEKLSFYVSTRIR